MTKQHSNQDKRAIYLFGLANDEKAEEIIKSLLKMELDDPTKDIVLIIDSPGGSIDSMWSIIDTMDMINCNVHTLAIGKAMSAGSVLLLSGTPGKRYITANTRILVHELSGASYGTMTDIDNETKELQRINQQVKKHIMKKTKIKKTDLDKMFTKNSYITPEEAVKWGIADKVINRFSDIKLKGW